MSVTLETFREWQRKYRRDLNGFVRAVWSVEPDVWQQEAGDALSKDERRRIAIPSGHGVGKTAFAAWAAIHHLLTRYPVKVVITAPSSSTLEDGLLAEIKHWVGRLPPAVQQLVECKADRIELVADRPNAFISARTARADKPDALQGVHADYVLLIVDEAAGVPDAVFESAGGSMSGVACFMLMLGNPAYTDGYFARAITTGAGVLWWVRRVSCYEAKRAGQEFIDEIEADYGRDSNVFRVRVLGELPLAQEDTIIPLHLIQDAVDRPVDLVERAGEVWGLDVGGINQGESALSKRRGNWLKESPARFRGVNLMQLCGRVAAEYEGLPEKLRPDYICTDAIGMGLGVSERLRELGLPAIGVNVSETPSVTGRYQNLKAELWWKARGWFEDRSCRIPGDAELIRALSIVRIKHHSSGRMLAEDKDTIKRRLKARAPRLDAADSFILTFARTAAVAQQGSRAQRGRRGAIRRRLSGIV